MVHEGCLDQTFGREDQSDGQASSDPHSGSGGQAYGLSSPRPA